MSEHTPGLWVIDRDLDTDEPRAIKTADGEFVTHVTGNRYPTEFGERVRDAEAEANARLIASAPQLLEELDECITDLVVTIGNISSECKRDPVAASRWEGVTEHLRDRVRSARAAIAATEGE